MVFRECSFPGCWHRTPELTWCFSWTQMLTVKHVRGEHSGHWRRRSYMKADGLPTKCLSISFLLRTAGGVNHLARKCEQLWVIVKAGSYQEDVNRDWTADFNLKRHRKIHLTKLMVREVSWILWPILGASLQIVSTLWAFEPLEVMAKWLQFRVDSWPRLEEDREMSPIAFFTTMKKVPGSFRGHAHSPGWGESEEGMRSKMIGIVWAFS